MNMHNTKLKDCAPSIETNVSECLFCWIMRSQERPILVENRLFVAVADNYPVSQGHTLVLPRQHVTAVSDLGSEEMVALGEILKLVQERLNLEFAPDGYNIGINEGEAAGQTRSHLHIHVIPRYSGDVEEPRGGIRNIKKPLIPY
jgi:diadenosine tetraphosphate (Ap4A) HIT family hydrolase